MNLDKLNEWLIKNNCDVAYISDPLSINYFTGFNMDPNERIFALVAFKDKPAFIFAPELNVEEAKQSAWNGDVYGYLDEQNPWQKIANLVSERIGRPQKIAIEKSFVSIARLEALKSVFTDADF
ncbi:MAG: aminopeptidase P family N-terminal domain-containing protein, partial [Lactobacillus iners]|nr:aminopeptidase P family N-terminal domain-containing protein [Lactobacillus iners]